MFDKDNTLTAPYSNEFYSVKIRYAVLDECVETFGYRNVAVISNSAGSQDDKDGVEAHHCEQELQLKFIRHKLKKPNVLPDILNHFEDCCDPAEIAIVGDRVPTDIVMGNKFGCFTILV